MVQCGQVVEEAAGLSTTCLAMMVRLLNAHSPYKMQRTVCSNGIGIAIDKSDLRVVFMNILGSFEMRKNPFMKL
jgi:hypothetical protein